MDSGEPAELQDTPIVRYELSFEKNPKSYAKLLDENQSPNAGYGEPYQAQLYCTLSELRALLGIHIARIAFAYDLEVDACLEDILPPEPDKAHKDSDA
jgi:hypothetical protein